MSRVPGRKSSFCLPGLVWEGDLWWPDMGNATNLSPLGLPNSFDAGLGNSSGNQEGRESERFTPSGYSLGCGGRPMRSMVGYGLL